ncbi:MAG: ABC transporter permease [Chloroflexota bacterium]|nr:ABC transporter permease [Chloroflexota bacterium]
MSQQAEVNIVARPSAGTVDSQAPSGGVKLGSIVRTGGELQVKGRKQRSLWGNAWRQFRRHRLAMAGLVVFIFISIACFIGSPLYPLAINDFDFTITGNSLTWNHPFGTDSLGQDVLARILWGGRISIAVGLVAAFVAIIFGTLLGAVAGFFGGNVDSLLMRFTDLFISLPQIPLLLVISFLYSPTFFQFFERNFGSGTLGLFVLIVAVIGLLNWMPTARLVRASFMATKEKEFLEAARSIGATRPSLMFRHILPNVMSPIIVAATLGVGAAIITESALSFLGLGFPSDVPTWGRMLYEAKDRFEFSPHQAIFPGLMIFLTVLSINYIGDGLRDALDPRKTQ